MTRLDVLAEKSIGGRRGKLRAQVHLIRVACNDDGLREGTVKGAQLVTIALHPGRVFVSQPQVESQPAGDFEIVLREEVPVSGAAAEPVCWIGASGGRREAEHPIGKSI